MPTMQIRGRVLPLALKITITSLSSFKWHETATSPGYLFAIKIVDSAITVDVQIPEEEDLTFSLLLIRAFQLTRSAVDCIAFSSGNGLSIVFDEITNTEGRTDRVRFANDSLVGLCTEFDYRITTGPDTLAEMFNLVTSEPPLFLALNDLITAISVPGLVAINCARSVEGLRTILSPDEEDKVKGWTLLRSILNLERPYVEYITKASRFDRHGNKMARKDGTDNGELLTRSWKIMNRFLAYRKRGSIQLPLSEFPML